MNKKFILIIGIAASCFGLFAQNKKIDSLSTLLKNDKEDTNKINHLNNLAFSLCYFNPDSTILLTAQAAALARKINFPKGESNAYSNAGIGCTILGNYTDALDNYFKALAIDSTLNNKNGMAKRFCNIGIVYKNEGDYIKALDYDFKSLKISEENGYDQLKSMVTGNIGIVYDLYGDYSKALDYYFKALTIYQGINDEKGIAVQLSNIGVVYEEQKNHSKALEYHFRTLKLAEKIGDKHGMAIQLGNIGIVYKAQGDSSIARGNFVFANEQKYPMALDYYLQALKIHNELQDESQIAITTGNIGKLYLDQKKYKEAEEYLLKTLNMAKETHDLYYESQLEVALSTLYAATNRAVLALEFYKNGSALKDSIFNKEKSKEITRKEMNYEFEKKELAAKAAQEKKDALAQADARRQKLFFYFILGTLILVLAFAGFIFRSLRITRKQKEIIEIKNRETEMQKLIIEEKNKDILDSIYYARRIQTSLLPTEKYISKNLQRQKMQSFN